MSSSKDGLSVNRLSAERGASSRTIGKCVGRAAVVPEPQGL